MSVEPPDLLLQVQDGLKRSSMIERQELTPCNRSLQHPHHDHMYWLNQTSGIALGMYNVSSYTRQVFKTSDGGNSWQGIHGDLPPMNDAIWSPSYQFLQILDENSYVLVQAYKNASGLYENNI